MKYLSSNPVPVFCAADVPSLNFYTDTLKVLDHGTYTDPNRGTTIGTVEEQELNFDSLRSRVLTDPAGLQEVRVDKTVDLTTLGALFINICTIPAGSKVKCAIVQILTLIVAGGTSVKVGIGTHGTSPSLLGKTADLLKNTQNGLVPADAASLIAGSTNIDLSAVATAGAIGDTNISAGSARVILVYDTPVVLTNV